MKYSVQVNRSQFDAMPVVVLPIDPDEPHADVIPIGTEVHVFTRAELRARDERIIRAALTAFGMAVRADGIWPRINDAIITAAEADA